MVTENVFECFDKFREVLYNTLAVASNNFLIASEKHLLRNFPDATVIACNANSNKFDPTLQKENYLKKSYYARAFK